MKRILYVCVCVIAFALVSHGDDDSGTMLSPKDIAEVKKKLSEYEHGGLDSKKFVETGGAEWARKVIVYYAYHTNDITTKMKLPISLCFVGFKKYEEAEKLAGDYVQTYSNDWHGWRILGNIEMLKKSFEKAIGAYTNAVKFGDEESLTSLGMASLAAEREDVLRDMVVPRLLVLKNDKKTRKDDKLEMLEVLLGYALQAHRKDVFVKAVQGVDPQDILSSQEVTSMAQKCCAQYGTAETEDLCRGISK